MHQDIILSNSCSLDASVWGGFLCQILNLLVIDEFAIDAFDGWLTCNFVCIC